jgi:hypothetical protein
VPTLGGRQNHGEPLGARFHTTLRSAKGTECLFILHANFAGFTWLSVVAGLYRPADLPYKAPPFRFN